MHILLTTNCNGNSNYYLIARTRVIILFPRKWKQNLFCAAVSAIWPEVVGTAEPCFFSLVLIWFEKITLNRNLWGIPNIAFIPVLFTQVSFSRLPKSERILKNSFMSILFTEVSFFVILNELYILLDFFSTAILLTLWKFTITKTLLVKR